MENRKMQTSADEGDKFADRRDPRLFVRAPKLIIYDKKISNAAKILYFILQDYGRSGKINVGVERLASDMEVSTRQIRNLLGELENKNLIRRLPVFNSPNRIVLLSLQPKEITPGDGDQQRQPVEPIQPTSRPEQRRPAGRAEPTSRPTTEAATASTRATASASRSSRADQPTNDRSGDGIHEGDRQHQPIERGEKYFHAGAADEARRHDEPAGKREIFFREGVKLISAKEHDSKKNHVCETLSADVSQKLPDKGKEGAGGYHLTEHRNPKPEQKTGENTGNKPDNLGYVALRNFGIWEGKARRLAEIAARQHGDAADQFISNWIEETSRRRRVQDPCAYLSSAVAENWKLPTARKPSATGSRNTRPDERHRQRQLKPIDFSKYANNPPAADERRDQDADRSAAPGATVTLPVYRETDLYLKCALKDYRPNTAYLLDYAELNGDSVKIRFMGGRQPVDFEPVEWLPIVKVYYPTVNHVEVIKTY